MCSGGGSGGYPLTETTTRTAHLLVARLTVTNKRAWRVHALFAVVIALVDVGALVDVFALPGVLVHGVAFSAAFETAVVVVALFVVATDR